MRGEHLLDEGAATFWEGSSPHARGARHRDHMVVLHGGLIPACAGSTPQSYDCCWPHGAHPRMRGEHHAREDYQYVRTGSSPHARGAPGRDDVPPAHVGLIPACAGSTPTVGALHPAERAHPRMRGEHDAQSTAVTSPRGSSPHARGALMSIPAALTGFGLIPACAGSTMLL